MDKDSITTEIILKEQKIIVLRIYNKEFISLTDLVRFQDYEKVLIKNGGIYERINC